MDIKKNQMLTTDTDNHNSRFVLILWLKTKMMGILPSMYQKPYNVKYKKWKIWIRFCLEKNMSIIRLQYQYSN